MSHTDPLAVSADPLAVLVSGGVDSAALVAEAAGLRPAVHPLYVRFGLAWEEVELAHLRRFLAAVAGPSLRPLVVLDQPTRDLYADHWSVTATGTPEAGTPDEDVFLPGRNVFFLAKAIVWCGLRRVPELALAPLSANPFPDGTPEFFADFAALVNRGIGGNVRVLLPYRELHKIDVLRRVPGLPWQHTFSCIRPANGRHCGDCSKCYERRTAFRAAGVDDPTPYERSLPCSA